MLVRLPCPSPPQPWTLSFFLSIHSPLLILVRHEVSIIKSWQLPRSYSLAKYLSWTSKFTHSTVHQTSSFEYPRYLKGTGAKMNISSSTCHKAHFYLPTLPVSENSTTLHPAEKIFPYHRSLSHSFWVASFLIMSPLEGGLYLLHCSSSHNQHCI